jgi:DNA-binding NarL/FixJ family response regulator
MIRVVVVDDQALVRGGFKMILAAQPDIEVVGEAENGSQAVALAAEMHPDIILMDIRMPVMDGLEATRRILASPDTTVRIVVLTTFDLDEYVYEALVAGASGFLLKETRPEVLADAIRTVAGGQALLAPGVLRQLGDQYTANREGSTNREQLDSLTEREADVLRLDGRGLSNAVNAHELWIAETTVKTHVSRIFTKLGLRDRAQAVVTAYETGLVEPSRGS